MVSLRRTGCALLITAVLFVAMFSIGNVRAATSLNGILTSDTTLTQNNSPYELTGPVCISTGVTLTIESGVTVNFGEYYLIVNGTLNARGTSNNKITLTAPSDFSTFNNHQIQFTAASTSWNEQTGQGSIIENAVLNVVSMSIDSCSPKIANNVLNKPNLIGIDARDNSNSIITGNVITCNYQAAINAHGSPTVTNNVVTGTGFQYGIYCAGNAYVANNKVSGCWIGIKASGNAIVEGNTLIENYDSGIEIASASAKIQYNCIAGNKHSGITGSGIIQYNYIGKNSVGITNPTSEAVMKNNNIQDNKQYNIVLSDSRNVDASSNWWGTTDTQAINSTIKDFKNDFNLGNVEFLPILDTPNTQAPAAPDVNMPTTPNPNPTEPSYTQPPTQSPTNNPPPTTPKSTDPEAISDSSASITFGVNNEAIIILIVIVFGVLWAAILIYNRKRHSARARSF